MASQQHSSASSSCAVRPVLFFYQIGGQTKKTRIKPCLTIQDFIGKCCPEGTVVDSEKNRVFPSVTIDLVQRLEKGIESNPMHFKVQHILFHACMDSVDICTDGCQSKQPLAM